MALQQLINFQFDKNYKHICLGISASGPTKRWDIDNYIKLFEEINSKFPCKFFLAGGKSDEILIIINLILIVIRNGMKILDVTLPNKM